jgi:hypothetical protein
MHTSAQHSTSVPAPSSKPYVSLFHPSHSSDPHVGRFADEVVQVVNEFRLLDSSLVPFGKTGEFGVSYMVRRLLKPKLPVSPAWVALRRIASRLAAENGNSEGDYERYIEILTTRAANHYAPSTMALVCKGHDGYVDDSYTEAEEEYDLLAAAAFTNNVPLMESLIPDTGHIGFSIGTFGDPYLAAIASGHFAALDILLGRLPTSTSLKHVKERILRHVAVHGSPSLIEKYMPEWPAKHLHFSNIREKLVKALETPSVENFQTVVRTLETTSQPTLSTSELANLLELACWRPGWEDMVEYLISIGAPVDGEDVTDSTFNLYSWPLKFAACHQTPAIMQLLFQYGARVQSGGKRVRGSEIEEAAEKGRWDSVRILVAHGADINQALVSAVKEEREDIVRELLERGAHLDGDSGAQALEVAKTDGLESMVALLEELTTGNRKEAPDGQKIDSSPASC